MRLFTAFLIASTLVACSTFLVVFFGITPALVPGVPSPILGKVAWAGEVDAKIAKAVEPLRREVEDVKKSVDAAARESKKTRIWLLGNEVFKAREKQCEAIKAGDGGTRFWTERLIELREEYLNLAGVSYQLPGCEEL